MAEKELETKEEQDGNAQDKKTCFVIMPISDHPDYDAGHFNRVYKYIIKPACEAAGYKPDRADDTSKPNVIIVDILQKVLNADMAICDISSRNPNVFYELGFRQAFNKKTVLIRDNKTVLPFDTSSIRTETYDAGLRIDAVNDAVLRLTSCIKAAENASADELNPLMRLLATSGKAILPKGYEMSEGNQVILRAIEGLAKRISCSDNNESNKREQSVNKEWLPMPIFIKNKMYLPGEIFHLRIGARLSALKFLRSDVQGSIICENSKGEILDFSIDYIEKNIV